MKSHLLECVEMQNYKVEVQNHSEGMEAQDLFLKMGYEKGVCSTGGYPALIIATPESRFQKTPYSSRATSLNHEAHSQYKEITLPELRAMVSVQKYEELAKKYDGVKLSEIPNGLAFNGNYASVVVYPNESKIVCKKTEISQVFDDSLFEKLECKLDHIFSVITPKQKEYLVKTDTGYTLQVLSNLVDGHDGIIEVPEGAEKLIYSKENNNNYHFVNAKNELWCVTTNDTKWYECGITYSGYFNGFGCVVVWQRESLNDQVASAEQARQEQTQTREISECDLIDSGKLIIGGLGESFPVGLEHHGFTQPEELPFVGGDTKFATEYPAEFFRKDDELDGDLCVEYVDNAWNKQVGGDHYKKLAIQPMEYALQNKLDYAQANVVKYVTRHADKNGKQDLLKAIHNIELMIAHYYSDQE